MASQFIFSAQVQYGVAKIFSHEACDNSSTDRSHESPLYIFTLLSSNCLHYVSTYFLLFYLLPLHFNFTYNFFCTFFT